MEVFGGYFYHIKGLKGVMVILNVVIAFWRFLGQFGHFIDFGIILSFWRFWFSSLKRVKLF